MQYPPLPRDPAARAFVAPAPPSAQTWLAWPLADAFQGRLCEISCDAVGRGQATMAMALVLASQRAKEPVAWLQPATGDFYPPDAAAHGVDLAALALVQVGDRHQPNDRVRACEILLQAGGFGLVVLDLTDGAMPSGWGWQGRLMALARQHRTAVVLLTLKPDEAPSLGAWVALRLVPRAAGGAALRRFFDLRAEVVKSKGSMPACPWHLQRRGPDGLL